MAEIILEVGTKAGVAEAFKALTEAEGLSSWWTRAEGVSILGQRLRLHFGQHVAQMEVTELVPNHRVRWKTCADGGDWRDTEISFSLEESEGQVYVHFRQSGFRDDVANLGFFSMKWAVYLLSLKSYLDNGKGTPFPSETKINHC